MDQNLHFTPGTPNPLGASLQKGGINFAVFSSNAKKVMLCLFERESRTNIAEFPLTRTENIWHVFVSNLSPDVLYGYRIETDSFPKNDEVILDPCAKSVNFSHLWGIPKEGPYSPLGEIVEDISFSWEDDQKPLIPHEDLLIYELHVRGFTIDPSSGVEHPGSYLGIIEKIPYLKDLGINAIELLPIHEFNENEYVLNHPNSKKKLFNYWGYSSVNFFSPMARYAVTQGRGGTIHDFKTMVKALHKNNIEVFLDVVFNHTAEGDLTGPIFSFKALDLSTYYMLGPKGNLLNFSGCGNTFNVNSPVVLNFVLECLRYWTTEMHVDGFRFDLASVFCRGPDGHPLTGTPPILDAIAHDPILKQVKLIAEPWDAAGLYQLGYFSAESPLWSEWNGKYRDAIRKFIKGTDSSAGEFAMRICGSQDIYPNRSPQASINYIISHDGFTLADLVSYNFKHNLENGENNSDGTRDNESWNCGVEGYTSNSQIQRLRERQMKNFHLALMVSQGIPMLSMGDEYAHSKQGNNNTWCQDNLLNWFQWGNLSSKQNFFTFYKRLVQFRKEHRIFTKKNFLSPGDIDWHGIEPYKPDWGSGSRFVAFVLKDNINHQEIYIAFNMFSYGVQVEIPPCGFGKEWHWVVNTASVFPYDFYSDLRPIVTDKFISLIPHSAVMLESTS